MNEWACDVGGMILTGEKFYPTATLYTTNPAWIGLELNPDLRGERQATNSESRGQTHLYRITLLE